MACVLSIDQGTSGTKAVLIAGDDAILGIEERPITPRYAAGGVVEQDPEQLWESVVGPAQRLVKDSGVVPDILTLANQGESVLAWDPRTGEPLTPIIVWQDTRAASVTDRLKQHEAAIQDRTGLRLDPYFSAPKMTWIRENLTREGVVTTTDAWLIHRLTGEFVTDHTTASRSLVYRLDRLGWDEELLSLFGLAEEHLPRIVRNDEIVGTTKLFGSVTPVGGLVADQQAALIAQQCFAEGEAKCTLGTGAFLMTNSGVTPGGTEHGLVACTAWVCADEHAFCLDGQVYAAASMVRWMVQIGLIHKAADLDRLVGDDAGGVLAVPALAGFAAPWWREQPNGAFRGMSLSTTKTDLVTATVQGLAAQVAHVARASELGLGRPMSRLNFDGGLTRSKKLMTTLANLLQRELRITSSPHATPIGAAALARKALRPEYTLSSLAIPLDTDTVFAPDWSPDRAESFMHDWTEFAETLI